MSTESITPSDLTKLGIATTAWRKASDKHDAEVNRLLGNLRTKVQVSHTALADIFPELRPSLDESTAKHREMYTLEHRILKECKGVFHTQEVSYINGKVFIEDVGGPLLGESGQLTVAKETPNKWSLTFAGITVTGDTLPQVRDALRRKYESSKVYPSVTQALAKIKARDGWYIGTWDDRGTIGLIGGRAIIVLTPDSDRNVKLVRFFKSGKKKMTSEYLVEVSAVAGAVAVAQEMLERKSRLTA